MFLRRIRADKKVAIVLLALLLSSFIILILIFRILKDLIKIVLMFYSLFVVFDFARLFGKRRAAVD